MTTRKRTRGFTLVIALLLGTVTAAIAVGLIALSGSSVVGAAHSVGGSLSAQIAEAGMQRTVGFALQLVSTGGDFDLLLDPGLEANCTQLSAVTDTGVVPEVGNMNLPQFTDPGTSVTTWGGKRYRVVPYNGGAYMVRVEDDDDDSITNTAWNAYTATSGSCKEGPTAVFGINNPARDRNRTIWAVVVGIYPGTDPAEALHRTVLRKLVVKPIPAKAKVGMQTGGNFEPNSVIHFCSTIAGVAASGEVQAGGAGSCYCGDVSKAKPGLVQCASCCGSGNALVPDLTTIPPAPAAVNPTDGRWFDWTSECNFYMNPTVGFFWWDPDVARGPGSHVCSDYTGSVLTPGTDSNTYNSCWVPIIDFSTGSVTVPISALNSGVNQEVFAVTLPGPVTIHEWRPRAAAATYDLSSHYTGGRTLSGEKPNWSSCPDTAAADFLWNPPSAPSGTGVETMGCTACDGVQPTVTFWPGATPAFRFNQSAASLAAWPVGVYFHQGNLAWVNQGSPASIPTTQSPSSQWPMMSLVINGSLAVGGTDVILLGAGTRKADFVALVANGINMGSGSLAVAGSVYVNGTYNASGGHSWNFGRIESTGNIHFEGSSVMDWRYDVDLSLTPPVSTEPPHLSVGLPL